MGGRKPRTKVTSLAVKREGNKLTATWKIPSDLSKGDYEAAWIDARFEWARQGAKITGGDVWRNPTGSQKPFSYTGWDHYRCRGNDKPVTGSLITSISKPYDRARFHPVDPGKYCKSCAVKVNGGWSDKVGPMSSVVYAYWLPRPPSVSWEFNQENATGKVTVKTNEGKDAHERYDTMVKVAVRRQDGKEAVLLNWTSTRSTEWTYQVDASPYVTDLVSGKWVDLRCWAYARGMAGDNPAQAKAVYASRSIALPVAATVGAITCDRKADTGRIKVGVATGGWTFAMQLQRRHGEDGTWEDVDGALDDGDAKALYDSYGAAAPVPGEHVWYRVKSTRDGYAVYSAAKRADCLYTAKPREVCAATTGVISVVPSDDGSAAWVKVGFNDSTPNTGTELSWSERHDGWNTTDGPSTDTFTGSAAGMGKYARTASRTITGLEPGKTYYIRVRRYREVEGETLYSAYDIAGKATPFVTESAEDDRCGIVSVASQRNGTEATVVVGIKEDAANDGTELSWSDNSGAWSSNTAQPETAEVTAPDDSPRKSDKWPKTQTYYIRGLEPGTRYYAQARRFRDAGGQKTYSPYSNRAVFVMESAVDDKCGIASVEPHADGKGATLNVGVDEDSPNTGTLVEFSEYRNAWASNEQPQSIEATWGFSSVAAPGWPKNQRVYIRGLEPGKTYYVEARRFLDSPGGRTYGPRSKNQSFRTVSFTAQNDKCGIVSLSANASGTGASMVVGWTEDTANTGTEVSWSEDSRAWWSNTQPNTLQATWSDAKSQSQDWKRTATVHLLDLEPGKTYYVRARRYLDDESGTTYTPYSKMLSVRMPETRSDPKVMCGMVSVAAEGNGTGAVCVVGWKGDRTGCEVSWSDDPDAWESNEQPTACEFEWADAKRKSSDWAKTATFHIAGLANGATYYVRARSYFDAEEGRVWSAYTKSHKVTPVSAPSSVSLTAPDAVERGSAIECWWSMEGELPQTEWSIHLRGQPNKALATGRGSLCRAKIPPERFADVDSVSFYVEAGCGGGLTRSNEVTVGVADRPSCEVFLAEELTAQPAVVEAYTDDPGARLRLTCVSRGISLEAPDGPRDQLEGDVVWTRQSAPSWAKAKWSATMLRAQTLADRAVAASDLAAARAALDALDPGDPGYEDAELEVEWCAENLRNVDDILSAHPANGETWMARVRMPVCDLVDGGVYAVSARTVEPVAGLESRYEASYAFPVSYSHQAPPPADGVTVTPDVEARSVTIQLARPKGAASTDVYDIYRRTPMGYELVAQGKALNATVEDPYAPFGHDELAYRIAVRTRDGDVDWFDYPYELPVHVLRFDWDGGFAEFPFDVEFTERFSKDFESRKHADGTVNGYWDRSVEYTGSYSTDVVKTDDAELVRLARRLGSHAGPVWVRDAHGKAMQCDVEVDEISVPNVSRAVALSFSVTRMRTTADFMPDNGDGA